MEFGRLFPIIRSSWRWMSCDPRLSVLSRSLLTLARASSHTFNTSLLRTISTLYSNNLPPIQQIHTDSYLSTSSPNGTPHVEHSGHVSFLGEERSRFNESQEPHQFLSGDGRTVVCVHPTQPTPISESRPLRPLKQSVQERRNSLTPEEVKVVRRLRAMDGALWTVNTLARHFNVRRRVISEVAPASLERQRELDEEKAKMAAMRPYKRKLYKAQKQMERQKRLEELLAKNRETLNNGQ